MLSLKTFKKFSERGITQIVLAINIQSSPLIMKF
jgi:hypothetical protein